jgi:hypothetical protein
MRMPRLLARLLVERKHLSPVNTLNGVVHGGEASQTAVI